MFYCEPCRIRHDWPESDVKDYGRCEVCERETACHDRPSATLPLGLGTPRDEWLPLGLPAPLTVAQVVAIKLALDLAESVTWPAGAPAGLDVYCDRFIRRLGEAGIISPPTAIEAHDRLARAGEGVAAIADADQTKH